MRMARDPTARFSKTSGVDPTNAPFINTREPCGADSKASDPRYDAEVVPAAFLRRAGGAEAARYGLVNRVEAGRDAAIAAGLELARNIAAKSPLAVAGAKRSLNYSRGRPVEEGLRDVALWNAAALVSADLAEAVKARLARSEPKFGPLAE